MVTSPSPLGRGRCFSCCPAHSRLAGRAWGPAGCSSTFPGSFRPPLCSFSQLALPALPLFDLLNLCFGSLFHTHSDSLLSPLKALGHLPGSEIKCEVKYSSDPHQLLIVSTLPHLHSPSPGCRMLRQARSLRKCLSESFTRKHSLAYSMSLSLSFNGCQPRADLVHLSSSLCFVLFCFPEIDIKGKALS